MRGPTTHPSRFESALILWARLSPAPQLLHTESGPREIARQLSSGTVAATSTTLRRILRRSPRPSVPGGSPSVSPRCRFPASRPARLARHSFAAFLPIPGPGPLLPLAQHLPPLGGGWHGVTSPDQADRQWAPF